MYRGTMYPRVRDVIPHDVPLGGNLRGTCCLPLTDDVFGTNRLAIIVIVRKRPNCLDKCCMYNNCLHRKDTAAELLLKSVRCTL